MDPWSLTTFLVCFGGGILGAALGGMYAFVLCGTLVTLGCVQVLAGGSDFLLLQVGLGPIFGPHVGGFTSGVVAVTYAEGIKKNAPGGEGSGKDILSPLMGTSWDVLAVGGVWAVLGHALVAFLNHDVFKDAPIIHLWDKIALAVVVGCMLSRYLFQKCPPWGSMESIKKYGYFGTGDGAIQWVPWEHDKYSKLAVFGLGVGLISAGFVVACKMHLAPLVEKNEVSALAAFVVPLILTWGLAAISLLGLTFATGTIQRFPVWHHIAILSSLAMLLFGSVIAAGIAGILAAILGDIVARMFYNHGTNHIDPPAAAIAVGTFVLNVINKILT